VDLALRRGRHIHKGDERWFRFLSEAQGLLEPFYRRDGCELEQRSDGYYFLLPVSDGLGKRHLGVPEMIVGQGLALCYLDPQSVQSGGVVTREELLNQLAAVMGTDALMNTLNPKRKRVDERVMQRTVRQKVNEALRRLSLLGFVELLDAEQLRLAPSLMRFAEPVRGLDAPSEALERLIARGEVSLGPGDAEHRDGDEEALDEIDDGEETFQVSPVEHESPESGESLEAASVDPDSSLDLDWSEGADLSEDGDSSVAADPSQDGDSSEAADSMRDDRAGADVHADGSAAAHTDEATALDPYGGAGESFSGAAVVPAATSPDGAPEPASEPPAPRATLASPAATYEGFPANDRGHTDSDDGDAAHDRSEVGGRASDSRDIDGATRDGHWADETVRAGSADLSPEHVEIDFDWDTLPDEEV
jgi:chromosome partition protein MukE